MSAVVTPDSQDVFMSVKQVAAYLHLNEKKVYSLVSEGRIPATKVTGKWMFPRELVDRWMLDATHGGLLTDRLLIAGSDDPLMYRIITAFARDIGASAQISYTPTGTRLGIDLLQAHRVDVSTLHWGPIEESRTRHPALLRQHPQHHNWVLIRAFSREQGLMVRPGILSGADGVDSAIRGAFRWVECQPGSGAQRFVLEMRKRSDAWSEGLDFTARALSEREAAVALVLNQADVAPGARATAAETGLGFVSFGSEAFDLVLPRNIWFRHLFQELLARLRSGETRRIADELTGYDFSETGELIWGEE